MKEREEVIEAATATEAAAAAVAVAVDVGVVRGVGLVDKELGYGIGGGNASLQQRSRRRAASNAAVDDAAVVGARRVRHEVDDVSVAGAGKGGGGERARVGLGGMGAIMGMAIHSSNNSNATTTTTTATTTARLLVGILAICSSAISIGLYVRFLSSPSSHGTSPYLSLLSSLGEVGDDDQGNRRRQRYPLRRDASVANHPAPSSSAQNASATAASMYALLYPTPDCSGRPLRIDSSYQERLCSNCRDLCHAYFPDGGEGGDGGGDGGGGGDGDGDGDGDNGTGQGNRHPINMHMGTKSMVLVGHEGTHRVELLKNCVGTWAYEEPEEVNPIRIIQVSPPPPPTSSSLAIVDANGAGANIKNAATTIQNHNTTKRNKRGKKRGGQGCIRIKVPFGHVRFVQMNDNDNNSDNDERNKNQKITRGSLPIAKSDDIPTKSNNQMGDETNKNEEDVSSYALVYHTEYCTGKPFRINYNSREIATSKMDVDEKRDNGASVGETGNGCVHCRDFCTVRFPPPDFDYGYDHGGGDDGNDVHDDNDDDDDDEELFLPHRPVSAFSKKSIAVFGRYDLDVHRLCVRDWKNKKEGEKEERKMEKEKDGYIGDAHHDSVDVQESGYLGTIRPEDGCVNLAQASERVGGVRFVPRETGVSLSLLQSLQSSLSSSSSSSSSSLSSSYPSYNVVFSVESSYYMAWQSRAVALSFRQTQNLGGDDGDGNANTNANANDNDNKGRLTRLLTSREPDDLMDEFDTIQNPRHVYSKWYSPYNKPDSLDKWLHSSYAPKEDVIVIIDPDNFLLKDLRPWVRRVKRGRPIAQAAWYHNDKRVDELWSMMCEANCNQTRTDHSAVPIFIHRDDITRIAPLWSYYTMKVKWWENTGRLKQFEGHQMITWSVEMIGYVFASAHAGVLHDIEPYLQLRDVDPIPSPKTQELDGIPMLHAGRAFFPLSYEPGGRWHNPEGEKIAKSMGRGRQVWCKCNYTAWDVLPWPLPSGDEYPIDFVSNHTLRILHEAKELNPTFPQSKYILFGDGRKNFRSYD